MNPDLLSLILIIIAVAGVVYYVGPIFFLPKIWERPKRELVIAGSGSDNIVCFEIVQDGSISSAPSRVLGGINSGSPVIPQLRAPVDVCVDHVEAIHVLTRGTNTVTPNVLSFDKNAHTSNARAQSLLHGINQALDEPCGIVHFILSNLLLITSKNVSGDSTKPSGVHTFVEENGQYTQSVIMEGLLTEPAGIRVDIQGFIYIANAEDNRIMVIGSNNIADEPTIPRTIAGPNTGLEHPRAIALDNNGLIYVACTGNNQINIYPSSANGNVAPVRTIKGKHTNPINQPTGVAADHLGRVYVSQQNSIHVYPADANGNTPPVNIIHGDDIFSAPMGLYFREDT